MRRRKNGRKYTKYLALKYKDRPINKSIAKTVEAYRLEPAIVVVFIR